MADHDDDAVWDDDLRAEEDPYDNLSDDLDSGLTHDLDDEIGMGAAERPAFEPQPAIYAPSSFRSDGLSSRRFAGPAVDEHGRLVGHVSCRNCGYNLRGQPLDGACSECGAAVEWSAKGDRLCYCDPKWIGSLKSGMTWFIASIISALVLVIIYIVFIFAVVLPQITGPPSGPGTQPGLPQMMQSQQGAMAVQAGGTAVGLILTGLFLVAVLLLTRTEPGKIDESPWSSRQIFRIGWIIASAIGITGSVMVYASPLIGTGITYLSQVLSLVAYVAMFVYLRKLALRVPAQSLATQTSILMWGLTICLGVIFVGNLIMLAMSGSMRGSGGPPGIAILGGCMMGIASLAAIIFGIWGFVLTFFYRGVFAQAERGAIDSRS